MAQAQSVIGRFSADFMSILEECAQTFPPRISINTVFSSLATSWAFVHHNINTSARQKEDYTNLFTNTKNL